MADVLASFVQEVCTKLIEYLTQEACMLLGVSSEIKNLGSTVHSLKGFLADAERKRITDQSVQRWVSKFKHAMYDAIDILQLCQLEADELRDSKSGNLKRKLSKYLPSSLSLQNPKFAWNIGRRIKELNQSLDEIQKEATMFKFITLGSYQDPGNSTDAEHSSRKTTSEFIKSTIVGEKIERDTKELVQVLITDDNHNIKQVVSIVGAGGMGKTTLASKIYSEKTIQENFTTRIWLSITPNFDEADLLRTAISHAGGHHGGEQDKSLLTQTLTKALSSRKFLVFLDDMWSAKAWDDVLRVPIMNAIEKQPGSRIVITTRSEDLAPRMQASFHQHHVSPLGELAAWSLLKKQLMPDQVGDQLKDVGMRIVRKCGGLPLAIKLMGGLLRTRYPSEREWEVVFNHQSWSTDGLPMELNNTVYLSYDDLSPHLKQCFLYCSLFPKGTNIKKVNVVPMWIAEGFIPSRYESYDRSKKVADEYYSELILRNLIGPAHGYAATGSECTMHDVVRSFAEYITREESLFLRDDEVASGNLVRRLSVGTTQSVPEWAVLQKHELIRTLIINCKVKINPGDSWCNFSSLRVLSIEHADCDRLDDSICQLLHLRYFALCETNISKLPDDINRLKCLQHIVLRNCRNLSNLPINIIKLVHLRTLDIKDSNVNVIPNGFGGLTNLMTVEGFPVCIMDDRRCSLEEIAPLSQLENLSLHGLEKVSTSSSAEKAMISSKEHLSYLYLNCSSSAYMASADNVKRQQQEAIEEVFDELCPPTCIERLGMKGGYFGRRLPKWMMAPASAAFKSLRFLDLNGLPCCTQLPGGLCQLLSLQLLTIRGAPAIKIVGPEFQESSSSSVARGAAASSAAAFPKLRNLQLFEMSEWEEWQWEDVDVTGDVIAMPALMTLYIRNCKLSRLPPGLANSKRHTLTTLRLYHVAKLTTVENIPSVVDLFVFGCPNMKRISCFSRVHNIWIDCCPNLEVLEGVPLLDTLRLEDIDMETLPEYLRDVKPRCLILFCGKKLYESLTLQDNSSEHDKLIDIKTKIIRHLPK